MDREMLLMMAANWHDDLQQWEGVVALCAVLLVHMAAVLRINQAPPARYAIMNREQQLIRALLSDGWEMKKHLRVSRESFRNLLQLIMTEQRSGWDQQLKLAVFLFWLASGASYRVVSTSFHVPKSGVHQMVHQMMRKVVGLRRRVIRLPLGEELEGIGRGFVALSRTEEFRNIVGAIDGCHVEIVAGGPHQADYFSRKLRYSIQFQAVCDHQGCFIHLFAGYPGSVHDARVLRESSLMAASYPPQGYAILGDSGYPCIREPIAIMTPYREPVEGNVQARYNYHHRRGRNIIERAFGMLKSRWRCIFMQRVPVKHTKVANVIGACCIMHNICIRNGDIAPVEQADAAAPPVPAPQDLNQVPGFRLRDGIAAAISRPQQLPPHLNEHDYF